jgi:hypothetical protein
MYATAWEKVQFVQPEASDGDFGSYLILNTEQNDFTTMVS